MFVSQTPVEFGDDDETTRRLDAIYREHDSHLDGVLAAAQAEAVREGW